MLVPANPAAEQVARLRGVNDDIREQITQLEKSITANDEIIAAFEPIGEWTELPDPVPEQVAELIEQPAIEVLPYADSTDTLSSTNDAQGVEPAAL